MVSSRTQRLLVVSAPNVCLLAHTFTLPLFFFLYTTVQTRAHGALQSQTPHILTHAHTHTQTQHKKQKRPSEHECSASKHTHRHTTHNTHNIHDTHTYNTRSTNKNKAVRERMLIFNTHLQAHNSTGRIYAYDITNLSNHNQSCCSVLWTIITLVLHLHTRSHPAHIYKQQVCIFNKINHVQQKQFY